MTESIRPVRVTMQPPGSGRTALGRRTSTSARPARSASRPAAVGQLPLWWPERGDAPPSETPAAGTPAAGTPVATGHVSFQAVRRAGRNQAPGQALRGPQRVRHDPDYLMLVSVVVLAAVGLLMIYSSSGVQEALSPNGDLFGAIAPQLTWTALGIVAMIVMLRVDYRYLRLASVPAYVVAVGGLLVILVLHFLPTIPFMHAIEVNGSARWLQVGPLPSVHPAEFAKLALVVYLAHWLATRGGESAASSAGRSGSS